MADVEIVFVLPERPSDDLFIMLTTLAHEIGKATGETGLDDYGAEWVGDVFEMHRYYWGDCTCGWEDTEVQWHERNQHLPKDIYELNWKRDWFDGDVFKGGHADECLMSRPNFIHKPTGFRVDWYKYIGREMVVSGEADLHAVFHNCCEELRRVGKT